MKKYNYTEFILENMRIDGKKNEGADTSAPSHGGDRLCPDKGE